jgi:hypothetical protein
MKLNFCFGPFLYLRALFLFSHHPPHGEPIMISAPKSELKSHGRVVLSLFSGVELWWRPKSPFHFLTLAVIICFFITPNYGRPRSTTINWSNRLQLAAVELHITAFCHWCGWKSAVMTLLYRCLESLTSLFSLLSLNKPGEWSCGLNCCYLNMR